MLYMVKGTKCGRTGLEVNGDWNGEYRKGHRWEKRNGTRRGRGLGLARPCLGVDVHGGDEELLCQGHSTNAAPAYAATRASGGSMGAYTAAQRREEKEMAYMWRMWGAYQEGRDVCWCIRCGCGWFGCGLGGSTTGTDLVCGDERHGDMKGWGARILLGV